MSHQKNIADQIRTCIKSHPGLRAKDIGSKLGLTRSIVNSYLYTKKPPALGNEVHQDSNYGWHIYLEMVESPTFITANSEPEKFYPREIVEEVFRDPKYSEISDNDQAKLGDLLEKARERQEREKNLAKVQKRQLLIVLGSASFWVAVAIGGIATYAGLKLIPNLLQPAPVEQPTSSNQTS